MSSLNRLRRRILTPDVRQTKLSTRGFHLKDEPGPRPPRDGRQIVPARIRRRRGGERAARGGAPRSRPRLPRTGASPTRAPRWPSPSATPCPVGRRPRRAVPRRPGDEHVYMAYVGVGWAMARLPRVLWSRLYAPDPLLRWLVLDGYGFHQAYFRTDTVRAPAASDRRSSRGRPTARATTRCGPSTRASAGPAGSWPEPTPSRSSACSTRSRRSAAPTCTPVPASPSATPAARRAGTGLARRAPGPYRRRPRAGRGVRRAGPAARRPGRCRTTSWRPASCAA